SVGAVAGAGRGTVGCAVQPDSTAGPTSAPINAAERIRPSEACADNTLVFMRTLLWELGCPQGTDVYPRRLSVRLQRGCSLAYRQLMMTARRFMVSGLPTGVVVCQVRIAEGREGSGKVRVHEGVSGQVDGRGACVV